MNIIVIGIDNKECLTGVVYTYCQNGYRIDRLIEGNSNFLKNIQNKNNIMNYLKEGQSLILKEGIIWQAYLGTKKIEGCSYKPKNEFYEMIAEDNGTCLSEVINNLEKSIPRPRQHKKKIDVDLLWK